jgi:glycosidase
MFRRVRTVALLVVAVGFALSFAGAQDRGADSEVHPWWQHTVFYEICPRSFADSNGDGIGDSASSRTSAHRDWYIWRDGKAPGVPPNNWISDFGGSTWQFDPKTGQYYYHFFEVQQPDLNWRNSAVGKAMFDVTRFWYKNGVSGFRLDAVDLLFEDPDLHDNPVLSGTTDLGDPRMENKYNDKLPVNHSELKKLPRWPTRIMRS